MKFLHATRRCYDKQAKHFVQTRKKHRPELGLIVEALPDERPLEIADLGCGGGRLYETLAEALEKNFSYIGIDHAQGMIDQAEKNHPDGTFRCEEMLDYLRSAEQDSLDAVICLASFQHIFPEQQRILHLHHIYNALRYGGRCIMINWSFSSRFLQKYRWRIVQGVGKSIIKADRQRNDYLIPRKTPRGSKTYTRYYHIFTLSELEELAGLAGFVVLDRGYTYDDGSVGDDWKKARNSFVVLEKGV